MVHRIQKVFGPFPFAHRQFAHAGHCRFVHGHNWTFTLTFEGELPKNSLGFLLDFGEFKPLKDQFVELFDHTCVLNANDPLMAEFTRLEHLGAIKLTILNNGTSSEQLAQFVYNIASAWLEIAFPSKTASLVEVRVEESPNNSATYRNP